MVTEFQEVFLRPDISVLHIGRLPFYVDYDCSQPREFWFIDFSHVHTYHHCTMVCSKSCSVEWSTATLTLIGFASKKNGNLKLNKTCTLYCVHTYHLYFIYKHAAMRMQSILILSQSKATAFTQ